MKHTFASCILGTAALLCPSANAQLRTFVEQETNDFTSGLNNTKQNMSYQYLGVGYDVDLADSLTISPYYKHLLSLDAENIRNNSNLSLESSSGYELGSAFQYDLSPEKDGSFYALGDVSYASTELVTSSSGTSSKEQWSGFYAGLGVGGAFAVSDIISFSGQLKYQSFISGNNPSVNGVRQSFDYKETGYGIALGLDINL